MDGVSEHGAKRVRVGTELSVKILADIVAWYAQSSLAWFGLLPERW